MIETKLNNLEINELTEEQYKREKEAGLLNSDAIYITKSTESISEVVPITRGGTNANIAADARINLGFEYGEEVPTHVPPTGDGAIYFKIEDEDDGILSIEEGGTGAVTVEEIHANLGQDDYVVEQGTDGIWTYRKWNSGIAECWGQETSSTAISTAWGAIYIGSMPARAFPTGLFTKITTINKSIKCLSGYSAWLITYTSGDYNTTDTGVTEIARPTSVTSQCSFNVSYHAIGSWK